MLYGNLKSHFLFNRQQRSGILFLVLLILCLQGVYFFFDFSSEEDVLDLSSHEIRALVSEIDSIQRVEIEARKPKRYPFNPNFISDFKGYTLGMSSEEIDRLLKFRKQNKWINSASDFHKVTRVSDSLLNELIPFFKFPEWVTNPKKKKWISKNDVSEKQYSEKIDLNEATIVELQTVRGIGETLSTRIVAYRDRLGGFKSNVQLNQVYGLRQDVIERNLHEFTVKTPKEIKTISINKATASDIATIPGISFELAKKIWEFRILNESIAQFSDLEKIEGLSKGKLDLIKLYLHIDEYVSSIQDNIP